MSISLPPSPVYYIFLAILAYHQAQLNLRIPITRVVVVEQQPAGGCADRLRPRPDLLLPRWRVARAQQAGVVAGQTAAVYQNSVDG